MKSTKHELQTREIGKPANWDDATMGPCDTLSVVDAHGMMFSYWRCTWRERLAILFGRRVRLGVMGSRHPVVSLDTAKV